MSSLIKNSHKKFLLELDALIAYSSSNDRLHDEVSRVLDYFNNDSINFKNKIYIASSALLEYTLLLKSSKVEEEDIADTLLAWENFPFLDTKELDARSITNSALIRDEYNLSFFDSLHVGTAITHNLVIVGSDTAYSQIPNLEAIDFKKFYNQYLV